MFNWDWETKEKLVCDINEWKTRFLAVYDLAVSPDGEKIAAPVETEDKIVTVCVNGNIWENSFERICFLSFLPDSKIACLVLQNYEWSLALEDTVSEESFDYAWNLKTSPDGKTIAFNVKKGDSYGVCFNGKTWENSYFDSRDLFISSDGQHSATVVRTKNPQLLDIFSFAEGVWTVAVDSKEWDKNFIAVYGCTFSPDSKNLAATVRVAAREFTVAVNGILWSEIFPYAWEPLFIDDSNVAVPAKFDRGWTMVINGKPIWDKYFVQLWNQRCSNDGKHIAAVAAPEFGKWTVVIDGILWKKTFSDVVMPPVFSPDGKTVAAVVKDRGKWTVAVDGVPWNLNFDRIWQPAFSPDGKNIIVKAEKDGGFFIVLNGRIGKDNFEILWEPLFSPDGEKVLIKGVKNGKYYRKIFSLGEILK